MITGAASLVLAIPALKVKGPYLALLTQGFGEIIRIIMINWTPVTNGTAGILKIESPRIFGFTFDTLTRYYYLTLFFVVLGLIYQKILIEARTGRAFIAIREDSEAAELTGINVTTYKIRSFVLSSVYCAIAGTLYAMMIRYVSPDTFIANTSSVILWTAIVGPIIGGVVMQTLPEVLRFGGLTAVEALDLDVQEHQIAALIGPNGAGKTTVFNMVTGAYHVTEGSVTFNGTIINDEKSYNAMKPHKIVELGIARTFQNIRLFKKMSVLDNVMTGFHSVSKAGMFNIIFKPRDMKLEEDENRAKAMKILEFLKLQNIASSLAGGIPYGTQRLLEIGRALATKPKLLLLDEPAAGMNSSEKKALVKTIRGIRDEYNLAVLPILAVKHSTLVVGSTSSPWEWQVLQLNMIIWASLTGCRRMPQFQEKGRPSAQRGLH